MATAAYEKSPTLDLFRQIPRFGHSDDITNLFSTDSSQAIDYILGTIFIGALLLAIFLLWTILLFLFICLGPSKVGFLSGFSMREPDPVPPPVMMDTNHNNNGNDNDRANVPSERSLEKKPFRTPKIVWSVFIVCCILVVSCAVGCYIVGFKELISLSGDIQDSLTEIVTIGNEGASNVKEIVANETRSDTLRELVASELEYGTFCSNAFLDNLTGVDFDDLRLDAQDSLLDLIGFRMNPIASVQEAVFQEISGNSELLVDIIENYGVKEWGALLYVIPFCLMPLFMMFGAILTCTRKANARFIGFLTWIVLPISILFLLGSWLLCSALGVVIVLNADLCLGAGGNGNPDSTFLSIVYQTQGETSLISDAAEHWVLGCSSENPFGFIDDFDAQLNQTSEDLASLSTAINDVNLTRMQDICGRDFSILDAYLDQTIDDIDLAINGTEDTLNLLSCETLHPIYEDTIEQSICTRSPRIIGVMLGLSLAISFFGMILVTFRSAWLEVIYSKRERDLENQVITVLYDEDTPNEYRTYRSYRSNRSSALQSKVTPIEQEEARSRTNIQQFEEQPEDEPEPTPVVKPQSRAPSLELSFEESLGRMSVANDEIRRISSPKDPNFRIY